MLLNCGVGDDSCDTLELQGDQKSQSLRKSELNIHWKNWCWSWNYNILATWWEELTHWKRPWCWERWKAEGEGDDRGWLLDGITNSMDMNLSEFQELLIDREAWHAVFHWVAKSKTLLSDWTELNFPAKNKTCILSRVKQITSPVWMHETSARTWCTGKTQRDRVEREVGGGIRMGNTCKSMADSCQKPLKK